MSYNQDPGLCHVDEFHQAFGINQPGEPNIPDEPVHTAIAAYQLQAARLAEELKQASADAGGSELLIRLQLIQEELAELALGFLSRDPVEVLDALVDLSYVVDGTYLTTGLAHYKLPGLAEVHRSNMSKLNADGHPIIGQSGRVEKSPLYSPPDLGRVLREGEQPCT